jgi:hypothetical protein
LTYKNIACPQCVKLMLEYGQNTKWLPVIGFVISWRLV